MSFDRKAINAFYQKQKNYTGGSYNQLYTRFQNDYYLNHNLNKIRNRKPQYQFTFTPVVRTSYSQNKFNLQGSGTNYKEFKQIEDNKYLGNKLIQIFNRQPKYFNRDFFASKQVKLNSYNRLRELEKKRILEENLFYQTRIKNSSTCFSRQKLLDFSKEQQKYSKNLRKILPYQTLTEGNETSTRRSQNRTQFNENKTAPSRTEYNPQATEENKNEKKEENVQNRENKKQEENEKNGENEQKEENVQEKKEENQNEENVENQNENRNEEL